MQSFMMILLICSVTMSVLGLLYLAVMPLLANRYSEKGRYYAWLIIIIGLIIPFRPQWNNPLISVEMLNQLSTPTVQVDVGTLDSFVIPIATSPHHNVIVADTITNISWGEIMVIIWLMGVVVFLVYHGLKHYYFVKMLRRWSEPIVDRRVLSLFQSLQSEMGITRAIPLYLCLSAGSPMMVGLFKPRILLPTLELTCEELRFILKHELVHYKRKDLLYKYLVLVATALHWFNPIVYLIARAVAILCEMSCDTDVVQREGIDARQSYSETIIGVVKYQSKLKTAFSTNFYCAKKGMKKRIFTIMDVRKKKAGLMLSSVILTLAISGSYLFVVVIPNVSVTRVSMLTDSWSESVALLGIRNQIADLPMPTYLPEGFIIEQVWLYPALTDASDYSHSEQIGRALYIRMGNGRQSFDLEIKDIPEQEAAFDPWMLNATEMTINGRRAMSGPSWLSIQINEGVRYTFMWGAFEASLANPLGDDTLIRIAESLR